MKPGNRRETQGAKSSSGGSRWQIRRTWGFIRAGLYFAGSGAFFIPEYGMEDGPLRGGKEISCGNCLLLNR